MLLRIKGIILMGLVYRQFLEEEIGAIKSEMIDFFTINQTQKQKKSMKRTMIKTYFRK